LGETAALVAGIAAPLLLPPRADVPRLTRVRPLLLALLATIGFALFAQVGTQAAQTIALALGFHLPDEASGRLVYCAALFGTVWTIFALLGRSGSARLVAAGLTLVGASGYSLAEPGMLAAIALGLLLILWAHAGADELATASPGTVDDEQWLRDARMLADRMTGECVVVNDDDRQVTRIGGQHDATAVVVRVVRERGWDQVEVTVGAPAGEHTAAIELQERAGASASAPLATRYRIRGGRVVGDLGDGLAPLGGTIEIWPQRGARWRTRVRAPAALAEMEHAVRALCAAAAGAE
jgi:hypothetical protein